MASFAISDIHGCARTFSSLLEKIAFSKSDSLFLLGDYIDRGPDSKGVVDLILDMQEQGYQVQCLRGNHEQMMLDGFADYSTRENWEIHGGIETLDSFGISRLSDMPSRYVDFFKNLGYYIENEGYILVHAGMTFTEHGRFKDLYSMLWKRFWYVDMDYQWLGERVVVHGHTPQTLRESHGQLGAIQKKQYLNIDNGCVFAPKVKDRDMGNLIAFDMTNRILHWVPNIDME